MRRAVLVVAVAGALAFAASAGTASANVRYPVLGCWSTIYGGGNWNLQFKPRKCTMVTDPLEPGGPVCDDYGWLSNIRWSNWGQAPRPDVGGSSFAISQRSR